MGRLLILSATGALGALAALIFFHGWISQHETEILASAHMVEAIVLTFSAAFAFALYDTARKVPRSTEAFTQISNQVRDRDLLTAFDRWRRIRAKYGDKLSYETVIDHDHESGFDSGGHFVRNDRDCVLHVLNYYESWGIGIRGQALDEKMLKDWWRSTFVQDFIDLYPFIAGYRRAKGIEAAFSEFQTLAMSWATRAERAKMTNTMRRRAVTPSQIRPLPAAA